MSGALQGADVEGETLAAADESLLSEVGFFFALRKQREQFVFLGSKTSKAIARL